MNKKDYKILKLENRIQLLESRQPAKENYRIVIKLKRKLKHLKED